MLVKEFTGKNEKDATKEALAELNLTEDQVRVEVLDKGKKSILGIGDSSPARIRVFYDEISVVLTELYAIVKEIVKLMGIDAEIEVAEESDDRIYINVRSEEVGFLIGRKGSTLEALQFIISIVASKLLGDGDESKYRIIFDIENYRKKREETLKGIARKTAFLVKKTRRPKVLEPMNAYDRRIIHIELKDNTDVETRSEGEDRFRKVKIVPKNNGNSNHNNSGGGNSSDGNSSYGGGNTPYSRNPRVRRR